MSFLRKLWPFGQDPVGTIERPTPIRRSRDPSVRVGHSSDQFRTSSSLNITADDLQNFEVTNSEPALKLIAISGLDIVVTMSLDVYGVQPEPASTQAHALSRLLEKLSELKGSKAKFFQVSRGAYKSFKQNTTHSDKIQRKIERNELVDSLLRAAIAEKASDVHIVVWEHTAKIFFRVNKVLRLHEENIKASVATGMIRVMWNNYREKGDNRDDWNKEIEQDTSFFFNVADKTNAVYMIRGSSIPEKRGPSVVLRLRDTKKLMDLEKMGYTKAQLKEIKAICDLKQGLGLFTGPTNSGKSTTISTSISKISPKSSVIEVADPIELLLPNVKHFEVPGDDNEKMDRVLRSVLRHDPDSVVIGEIRSLTTIKAATNMSFSGTSVLSTMHTNSVVDAFPKMLELGLPESTIARKGFINGVISQNLIPVLCSCKLNRCRDDDLPNEQEQNEVTAKYRGIFKTNNIFFVNPKGCPKCKGTGVISLTLIAEVLRMNDETLEIVRAGDYNKLTNYMEKNGIMTKHQHAATKVYQGLFDPRFCEERIDPFTPENISAVSKWYLEKAKGVKK